MKLVTDWAKFDALQIKLLNHLIDSVCGPLVSAGIHINAAEQLLTGIVFHTCCVIDGSTVMPTVDGRILPVLTFAKDSSREEIISSGSTSWLHEYVHGAVEEYLRTRS